MAIVASVTGLLPAVANAQELGDQRSGTSAATFLKIGVDPRGVAMGSAFVSEAVGVAAVAWNPAALATLREPELMFAYVQWPGDIDYSYFAAGRYWDRVGGNVALQMGYLGVVMEETTESSPLGTGRNFGVRDWFVGISFSRQFTDRLSFGITGRFVRESLGTEVGGPTVTNGLLDAGTLYYMDFLDLKLAFSLQHFGPEFSPSGSYLSPINGERTEYEAFAPPTVFRLGISGAIYRDGPYELRSSLEMNHFSDAAETVRAGTELGYDDTFFIRAGYDASADTMKFSAGAGFHTRFGYNEGDFDYAYSDGGPLGDVHRFAIRIQL